MPLAIRHTQIIRHAFATLGASLFLIALLASPSVVHAALTNGANAIDALGQYDDSLTNPQPVYTKSAANNGPNSLGFTPRSQAIDTIHHRLFMSDATNNRIIVYSLTNGNMIATHIPVWVLGQPDFHTGTAATTQSGLRNPYGLAYDPSGNHLFVADASNRRVLVFDVSSIINGMNASYVLGQTNFTSSGSATTQAGMASLASTDLTYDTTTNHLFVSDRGNNRVLVFSGASLSNGMNATAVLGQPNFTTATAATTQAGMNVPVGLAYDPATNHLFVSEQTNRRVLVFSGASLSNGMNANTVLGKPNFTTATAAVTQTGMSGLSGLAYDAAANHLFVVDNGNHRVLVFSGASLSNGMPATAVLGQSDFITSTLGRSQSKMTNINGVSYDITTNHLFVNDNNNARVLIFSGASLSNGMNAADALGQYDDSLSNPQPIYTKGGANNGPNQFGLSSPTGSPALDTNNHRLFVPDSSNNRVLVYSLSSTNQLTDHIPDYVLGHATFSSGSVMTTQWGMSSPRGLAYDNIHNRLFVSDFTNHRVLVFSGSSLASGMNAAHVLGQALFTTATGTASQSIMVGPTSVAYDSTNDRLFVADTTDNRVMVYDTSSISDGMNATAVLGQATVSATAAATTQIGMSGPKGVAYDSTTNKLYVADTTNNRVLVYDGTAIATSMNATSVLGQTLFTTATAATTQSGMSGPQGVTLDPATSRLFVTGQANNRTLIYDTRSITNGMNATAVLGQSVFTASTAATTQAGLSGPTGALYDGTNNTLYVMDTTNSRLSFFDAAPNITGKLFNSNGTAAASGTIITAALNGTITASGITIPGGQFSISGLSMTGGTIVSLYTTSPTLKAATITMGSGGTMTGINLTQNTLTLRSDSSTTLTSAAINIAASHSIPSLFSSSTTTLTLSGATNLFAPRGFVSLDTLVLPSVSQTLSGSLSITTLSRTGSTLIIAPNSNLTITNLNLSNLTFRSTISGRSFNLSSTNAGISSIAVSDANNTGQNILECSSCTNNGNNSRWSFTTPATATSSSAAVSGSSGGGGGGGGGSTYVPAQTSSAASSVSTASVRSSARSSRSTSSALHSASSPTLISNSASQPSSLSTILRITNLRKNPTANSTLIATLLKNWQVRIQSFTGLWAKVKTLGGREGYILKKNVSDANVSVQSSSSSSAQPISIPTGAHTIVNLNVRISPDITAKVMAQLKTNTPVTIMETLGEWLKISFEGKNGFVVGKWVKQ